MPRRSFKMRSKSLILGLTVIALACGLLAVSAQEPDDEVRGAFLSSRPKTTNPNAPSRRHKPRNTNGNSSAPKNGNTAVSNANTNTNSSGNKNSSAAGQSQAIGLGYTLFMRNASGKAVRVEPAREF